MKLHVTVRSLVVSALTFALAVVLAYVFAPLWLMHSRSYATLAGAFSLSPYTPQALLHAAQTADPSPGPDFVTIFPGDDMASAGSAGAQANAQQARQAKQYIDQLITNYPHSTFAQTARSLGVQIDEQLGHWAAATQGLREEAASASDPAQSVAALTLKRLTETQRAAGHAQVVGQVTIGGSPLQDAYVFLRPAFEANSMSTDVLGTYTGAFTDSTGTYRIAGVASGRYQVCISVMAPQVAGFFLPLPRDESVTVARAKTATYNLPFVPRVTLTSPTGGETLSGRAIHFAWRAYPHAAYYQLSLTDYIDLSATNFSSVLMTLDGHYTTTHVALRVSSLRDILPGPAYVSSNGASSPAALAPASALGLVYPGGEFSWDVNAYDSTGKLLSSSRSVYVGLTNKAVPMFHLSSAGELQGDKLLLQHQQAAAIRAYQQDTKNPYALRALAVLALYGHGLNHVTAAGAKLALAYLYQIPKPTPSVQQLVTDARKQLAK